MLAIALSELALEKTALHGSGTCFFLPLCTTESAWPSPKLLSSRSQVRIGLTPVAPCLCVL